MPKDVRLITVQFSFTNFDVVPPIRRHKDETAQESAARQLKNELSTGYVILKATANCSLAKLPDELRMAGYKLVDAFYQVRRKSGRTYYMVRFIFSRVRPAVSETNFKEIQGVNENFKNMCNSALWRARVFSNLFYGDGGRPTGERVVNIALVARKPLFHPDGTPVTVWQKDEKGKRIGDSPRPLSAEYYLRIKEVVADVALAATEDVD